MLPAGTRWMSSVVPCISTRSLFFMEIPKVCLRFGNRPAIQSLSRLRMIWIEWRQISNCSNKNAVCKTSLYQILRVGWSALNSRPDFLRPYIAYFHRRTGRCQDKAPYPIFEVVSVVSEIDCLAKSRHRFRRTKSIVHLDYRLQTTISVKSENDAQPFPPSVVWNCSLRTSSISEASPTHSVVTGPLDRTC